MIEEAEFEAVSLLLELQIFKDDETALYQSSKIGSAKSVEFLLSRQDVDIEAKSKSAKETPLIVASKNGHADIVEMLMTHGANPDARDSNNYTSLYWARRNNHTETMTHLLNQDANKYLSNGTILLDAISSGKNILAIQLIQEGIDVNYRINFSMYQQ